MSEVTLSASVRQSLLSLQNTTNLIERTQNRLSTGLRVSAAIDDPVSFFQAKSLSDRSGDFLEKKDTIDQGISTVTAALDGVEAIEDLIAQMKGISNSMKSATDTQISDLVTQFNDIRSQVDYLATDATYQGTNLIAGTGSTLAVEFSEQTASLLSISSVDLTVGTAGMNVQSNAYTTSTTFVNTGTLKGATADGNEFKNRFLETDDDFTLTYNGSSKTFSAGETVSFTFGTGSSFSFVNSTAQALTLAQGGTVAVDITTALSTVAAGSLGLLATQTTNLSLSMASSQTLDVSCAAALAQLTVTYQGTETITVSTAEGLTFTFDGSQQSLQTTSAIVLTAGAVFAIDVTGSANSAVATPKSLTGFYVLIASSNGTAFVANTAGRVTSDALTYGIALNGGASATIASGAADLSGSGLVKAGDTTNINLVIDQLDTALTTLRTESQKLGSNVALLNTRLNFTEQYTNTLQAGADKLTLADINGEGANLLALQTRQQLGIQSLSLAAQAEAAILSLFG